MGQEGWEAVGVDRKYVSEDYTEWVEQVVYKREIIAVPQDRPICMRLTNNR